MRTQDENTIVSKTPEMLTYFLHKITCKRPQCWRILQIFCISCAWSYMPWSTKGAKLALDREEKDINLFRFKLLVNHFKIQPFLYPVKLVNSLQCFLVQFQLSSFMLDGPHQTLWRCSEINLGLTELGLKSQRRVLTVLFIGLFCERDLWLAD